MIWKLGRVSESRNASIACIALLLLVLAGVVGWAGWRVTEVRATASWPTVQGRLIEAEVIEHHRARVPGRSGTSRIEYEARARYTYEVDGQRYEGDRLRADTDHVEGRRR
ncbi:MAG: DUF3592 domain-containing protein [Planctomycetota bacterium]